MKALRQITPVLLRLGGTLLTFFVLWKAGEEYVDFAQGTGAWLGGFSPKLALGLIGMLALWAAIFAAVVIILWRREMTLRLERALCRLREGLGLLRWLLLIGLLAFEIWFLQYYYWGWVFSGPYIRTMIFLSVALALAALVVRNTEALVTFPGFVVGMLLETSALTFAYALSDVTDYPFSLYWSEGNRMWDYSVLFGHRLYNYPADQPIYAFLDRGRQSLWGLPFLFADINIVQMRIWSGLVLTIPYAIFGWIAFRRPARTTGVWLLIGLWTFVFLRQGPIYTPLVLSAILVALAWRAPVYLAIPLVGVAAYYAEMTRLTWMFAPAMWSTMLWLGEKPLAVADTGWRRRYGWPVVGVVLAGIVGGYILPRYEEIVGMIGPLFGKAAAASAATRPPLLSVEGVTSVVSRQPLLWDRLFPSQTYRFGILLALIMTIAPLVIFLIYLIRKQRWPMDWVRGAVLLINLCLFLAVGLVVSVKIGGGNNLHNLDMFLIGLVFTAALAWEAGGYRALADLGRQPRWVQLTLAAMIAIFALQPLFSVKPLSLPAPEVVQKTLQTVQEEVERASRQGEVLFIDQRQLLTFGYVPRIPLVVDYEKKYLMDKAMAGDEKYFRKLYTDLANHRFALIVSEPLRVRIRESDYQFGDENNAWVKWVSAPILCYYKPIATFRETRVELLEPRQGENPCPELPISMP